MSCSKTSKTSVRFVYMYKKPRMKTSTSQRNLIGLAEEAWVCCHCALEHKASKTVETSSSRAVTK